MDSTPARKISAIVSSERRMERIIYKLTQKTVARHDISVQGNPSSIADEFGAHAITPEAIQQSGHPPKKEPFLMDDFGWVLGFSFSIPFFIGLIIGIFIVGDVRSLTDNFFYGTVGGIIGGLIGLALATVIKNHHFNARRAQETKGGYVLWVAVQSDEQMNETLAILKQYGANHIHLEDSEQQH